MLRDSEKSTNVPALNRKPFHYIIRRVPVLISEFPVNPGVPVAALVAKLLRIAGV